MLYELRLYALGQGRTQDCHERMRVHLPPLLARHGIPVVGRWSAVGGPRLPLFAYLMEWPDFAAREAGWGGFYADPEWPRVRAATNAGSEMVERYDLLFLRPNAAFVPDKALAGQTRAGHTLGGVHELVLQEVAIGQVPALTGFLSELYLPLLREAGAAVIGLCDLVSGSGLPKLAFFLAWPDEAARRRGRAALDGDARHKAALERQRAALGRTLFGPAELYVLEPADYALPVASLGAG